LDKEIYLEMSGLETEFDRTINDEMGEALVHLIRNSADHGLEETAERVKQGKPAAGTIALRAYASGQSVFIEVGDDGAGVNVERVRARAVERGIISESVANGLSNQQVYELLFESGFSTADTISDISGRGVGLDAVKRKVESLSGRVHIESNPGQGTTFRIQLPLTMSILQALLVLVDGDMFAIPLGSVEEVVQATDDQLRQVHGQTVLNYRDKLVPIFDIGDWMYGKSSLAKKPWKLVIVKEGSKRLAISVDGLMGQQEVVNKSLGDYLKSNVWFSGGAILGDGSIALILDTHALMSL
jgi:two-component system chemotaxis sensor kinase CheA